MMRDMVVSGLEGLRKALYRGPVKRVVVALGLESALKTVYSSLLSAASHDEMVTHEVDGTEATFRVSTGMEVQRFRGLMDESEVIEAVLGDVEPDDVFYDVGANVGLYTCFVSQRVNQTVAFEPHPENLRKLRENVELNQLQNVEVREEALSDEDGDAELAVTGAEVAGEGTHALATGSETKTVEIRTAKADTLVGELPQPDAVKIDVEGAEMSVLRGMGETLNGCRLVYCETHSEKLAERGRSHTDVVDLLSDAGFSVETVKSRGEETFVRAEK